MPANVTALLHLGGVARVYPEIEPHDHGMLDVGDGHHLYWEVCGNPEGKPAVVVHGGPGSGCGDGLRRHFDPDAYRVVLFDQRNCGRSTPSAADYAVDLATNTTKHLLGDLEKLREHLGIERWLVHGGSWGSTLGLAYAQRHPRRVSELVIVAVTTTAHAELDWAYHGLRRLLPQQWHRFRDGVPEAERDGNLIQAYDRLINGQDIDPEVRERAVRDWCDYDMATMSIGPDVPPDSIWADPDFLRALARIVVHYFSNYAWLEDGELLRGVGRLAGIPAVLVHGALDLGAPLITAWELARAWPDAELVVIPDAAHTAGTSGMGEAVVAALDRFAVASQPGASAASGSPAERCTRRCASTANT